MIVSAYISDNENRVYMASDSLYCDGERRYSMNSGNIIKFPEENPLILIGVCGSNLVRQLISINLSSFPQNSSTKNMTLYLNDCVRPLVKEDVELLIAFDMSLFYVDKNFSLIDVSEKYAAIGHGKEFAMGVLFSESFNTIHTTQDKLSMAMDAACRHNSMCGGTINVEYI